MTRDNASDIEIAFFWGSHIENPCSVKVGDRIENIRGFYIREAREGIIPAMKNPFAIEYLEKLIAEYE